MANNNKKKKYWKYRLMIHRDLKNKISKISLVKVYFDKGKPQSWEPLPTNWEEEYSNYQTEYMVKKLVKCIRKGLYIEEINLEPATDIKNKQFRYYFLHMLHHFHITVGCICSGG